MKIQALDTMTKQPLANTRIQLLVKGKDSGTINLTTDTTGHATLDDKYSGQQITPSLNGKQGTTITASDGAKLFITTKETEKFK